MPRSTDAARRSAPARVLLLLPVPLALAGCAVGPRAADLLPDEGPTTLEVYERHLAGAGAGAPVGPGPRFAGGEPPAPAATAATRRGHAALADLRRDFQRVPDPEILGYVYPHLAGETPIPGYYTVFPLRGGVRYARPGEGEWVPLEADAP
ncbi:MAG: TIGR03751 family conjugal transfer lipoprotein [Candidatus Competibacteraceae bacterium]|nr:MAG: TIGR03751 family conjugal transfer lipoprotein [Candidatus Competibacteraceae bacterium]